MKAQIVKQLIDELDSLINIQQILWYSLHENAKELINTNNKDLLGILLIPEEKDNIVPILNKEISEGKSYIPNSVYSTFADMLSDRANEIIENSETLSKSPLNDPISISSHNEDEAISRSAAFMRTRININNIANKFLNGQYSSFSELHKVLIEIANQMKQYAEKLS
ncbi:MAG: hypothetical protein Q4C30_07085 [Bacteroidia bacterium]|nr:hypothetical protein [Bacteroidia bacterium]